MPVIGHAFVGLATAAVVRPPRLRSSTLASAGWTPAVVVLAYLPDVADQLAALCGARGARVVTHSLVFALAAAVLLAPLLARLGRLSLGAGGALVLASVGLHDVLDLLQSTDRAPWWPFSRRTVGFDFELIPANTAAEALLFAIAFGIVAAVVRLGRGGGAPAADARAATDVPAGLRRGTAARVAGLAVTGLILSAACATHYLRGLRERDLRLIRGMLETGDYAGVLALADRAERWPSTARPGRVDYARAEAYAGLGRHADAERCYLNSLTADPHYFWAIADLAALYASGDEPAERRRARSDPLVQRLRSEFAGHEGLPRALERINRRLARPPP